MSKWTPISRALRVAALGLAGCGAATLAWARSHQISYLIAGDAPAVRAAFVPGSPAAQPARELSSVALEFGPETVALRVTLPASQLAPLLP